MYLTYIFYQIHDFLGQNTIVKYLLEPQKRFDTFKKNI